MNYVFRQFTFTSVFFATSFFLASGLASGFCKPCNSKKGYRVNSKVRGKTYTHQKYSKAKYPVKSQNWVLFCPIFQHRKTIDYFLFVYRTSNAANLGLSNLLFHLTLEPTVLHAFQSKRSDKEIDLGFVVGVRI